MKVILTSSILLVLSLFAFQNCELDPELSPSQAAKSKSDHAQVAGNGEGYDGKLYVDLDVNQDCGNDEDLVKTALEKRNDGFYKVVENCNPIRPERVPNQNVGFETGNQEVVIYGNRPLFDRPHFNRFEGLSLNARLFCRGIFPDSQNNLRRYVVDLYFHSELPGPLFYSSALVGHYQGPMLLSTADFPEQEVEQRIIFVGGPSGNAEALEYLYNGGPHNQNGEPGYKAVFFSNNRDIINQAMFIYNDGTSSMISVDNRLDCYNY